MLHAAEDAHEESIKSVISMRKKKADEFKKIERYRNEQLQETEKKDEVHSNLKKLDLILPNGNINNDAAVFKTIRVELQEIDNALDNFKSEEMSFRNGLSGLESDNATLRARRDSNHRKLDELNNIRNKRLSTLQKTNREVHRAVFWLRENRHKFKGEIYEPVCLEINLKDARHANAVESLISSKDLLVSISNR